MPGWLVLVVSAAYVAVLFGIAWRGDRPGTRVAASSARTAALSYCLTLAIYNTSWSFYGSVGRAATHGFDFLPIYLGPALVLFLGQRLLAKVVAIAKAQNVTSIADFIAARYGKSQSLAALVTLSALLGVLPYIALQLKAVATSFDILTAVPGRAIATELPPWRDTAFAVALSMALFAIIFGVRHIHASEHHRGLMLAVAFESLVKLAAFLAVGLFIVFGMFDGFPDLMGRLQSDPRLQTVLSIDLTHPTWLSNTLIAAIAFLCLPQAFHVAVVENETPAHLRSAAWLYPAYLVTLSLFMVPIAMAGVATFGAATNPDTYMLALPLAAQAHGMGLVAFIGGFSAATGMVIVASVALSTMLCNDVVMPVLLRHRFQGRTTDPPSMASVLILVRRVSVVAILLLAYLAHRLVDRAYPLTLIGLVSFVAVAQFGPAFIAGLYWQRANRSGAIAGILVGFGTWAYTLLLPSILPYLPLPTNLVQSGPWGLAWLRPQSLFGFEGLDPISHATFWSLIANILVFTALSLLHKQRPVERIQAAAFTNGPWDQAAFFRPSARAVARLEDLRALAIRFVGPERGSAAFDGYLAARGLGAGPRLDETGLVDLDAVRFTENLLAGAIGAASARVIMAASLEGHSLSRREAMAMLDEASEALHFSRRLLQGTLESVPQGICAFDAELRITAWNGRFLELLDLPKDLIRVGLPLATLIEFNRTRGEYGANDLKALLINRDLKAQTWPYVYERTRPDGTVLEIAYDRMAEGGYVSTYTDVTERHRAAEALRRANESLEQRVRERTDALEAAKAQAEQANASKTRFLAAASHDLLQPLNAARLFLSALDEILRGEGGADRDRERVLVANATAALRSTEQLLDPLLDISSFDTGGVRAEPVDFAVSELLSQLSLEFSALARERGLTLRVVTCAAGVRSDPHLLRRVLQNLLSNAVRYTPRGRVLIGCRRRGQVLRIEVWDTGLGIPEEKLAEIFEEFRQLHQREGADKGLGLGLAIVDRIARLLDHPVDVRSRPGHGTCFAVTVPLATGPLVPVERGDSAQPGLAAPVSLLVLCLDNEEATLKGLVALLEGWGHQAIPAASREAALIALGGRVPDVVLVDYHLGGPESGPEILADLWRRWGRVQSLVITADRTEEVRREAQALGCEILLKPVKPAPLRRFLSGAALRGGSIERDDAA